MLFLIFPVPVQAGGIGTYNYATPDVGLAAAGSAARAQDAGTIATNPAGMMLLGETRNAVWHTDAARRRRFHTWCWYNS